MIRNFLCLIAAFFALASCNEESEIADVPESSVRTVTNAESESESVTSTSNPASDTAKSLNLEYQPDALKSEDYLQANEKPDARTSMEEDVEKYPGLFDKKEKKEKNITVKPLLSEERDPNLDLSIKSLKESVTGAEVNIRKDIE